MGQRQRGRGGRRGPAGGCCAQRHPASPPALSGGRLCDHAGPGGSGTARTVSRPQPGLSSLGAVPLGRPAQKPEPGLHLLSERPEVLPISSVRALSRPAASRGGCAPAARTPWSWVQRVCLSVCACACVCTCGDQLHPLGPWPGLGGRCGPGGRGGCWPLAPWACGWRWLAGPRGGVPGRAPSPPGSEMGPEETGAVPRSPCGRPLACPRGGDTGPSAVRAQPTWLLPPPPAGS